MENLKWLMPTMVINVSCTPCTSDYSSHPPPTYYIPFMSSCNHHAFTGCMFISRNVYSGLWKPYNFSSTVQIHSMVKTIHVSTPWPIYNLARHKMRMSHMFLVYSCNIILPHEEIILQFIFGQYFGMH